MDFRSTLEKISDHYETLFDRLRFRFSGDHLKREEESLFWEQKGCNLMMSALSWKKIDFEIDPNDIRPNVLTTEGKKVEIDFRIRILGSPIYFGVTHFHSRPLERDLTVVDEPITDLKEFVYIGDKLVETVHIGDARIIGRRVQKDYLNKRVVTRIAKEGRHSFPYDYVYILFPKSSPASGGGLDGIPASFEFGAGYDYPETGITGIVFVGKKVQVDANGNKRVRNDQMTLRTLSFTRCSAQSKKILTDFDRMTVDLTKDLDKVRRYLESAGIDPKLYAEFNEP